MGGCSRSGKVRGVGGKDRRERGPDYRVLWVIVRTLVFMLRKKGSVSGEGPREDLAFSLCLLTSHSVKVGILSLRASGHPQMIQEAGHGHWDITHMHVYSRQENRNEKSS